MSAPNQGPPQPPWPPQPGGGPQGQQPPPFGYGQVPGPTSPGYGQVPGQPQPMYGQVPGQPPTQPGYGPVPGQPPSQPGYGPVPGQPPSYGQPQPQGFDPANVARNAGQWANGMVQRHGLRTILHVAVPVLTVLGLIMPTQFLIQNVVWAVFAIAVAAGSLVGRRDNARSWSIAFACFAGLFLYWVLIALPSITSFGGFLVTAAVVAAGWALWIHPHRKWV